MNENEIKEEFDINLQCRACLSVGRKLLPLSDCIHVFKMLTSQISSENISRTLEVCWECHAILRRAAKFQRNVQKANDFFQSGENLCGTLSTLTTAIIDNTTHKMHVIYINESKQTETKPTANLKIDEFSDNEVSDNQTEYTQDIKTEYDKDSKKTNRWALQRAIQNKKPKFKLLTDCDEVFNTIKLGIEELHSFMNGVKRGDYYKLKKYKCKDCLMSFKSDSMLLKHMRKYHKETNKFTCDICKSTFAHKHHLTSHLHQHYNIYECTLCGHRCRKKKERTHHFKREHRKVFQCLKCHLKFCSRREFFKHFKEWHENFICDHCGISFKMRYCIKDHIKKQHSSFECKACNKIFARYNGLWLHNKLRHTPPGQTAYCVECDKRYVDIYRYRWHLANSTRHKPRKRLRIPCPGCDKIFSKNIYMKDHYNLVHLKYYKYRCEECDKNFIRNADLVKHRRRVHEGILPPKNKICDMCGRGFSTNKILTNHMRTHTGERPFVCTVCPAKFAQNTALASHIRAVHEKRDH